jgi:hypothetical protein
MHAIQAPPLGRERPVTSKKKLQHDKCRMSIDPPQADRIKEFFLFYLLKIAERSDIHNSSIDIHHSSFDIVSYERRRWPQASSQIEKETTIDA